MSTGDYLRYLRARKGGPTPWQIEEATGIPSNTYRQMEQRYRAVGAPEELEKLAEYFGVASKELGDRHAWTRKELSAVLVEAQEENQPLRLYLRSGERITGQVIWSDLGAALLKTKDGVDKVIQRHFIDQWEFLDEQPAADANPSPE